MLCGVNNIQKKKPLIFALVKGNYNCLQCCFSMYKIICARVNNNNSTVDYIGYNQIVHLEDHYIRLKRFTPLS